MINKKYSLDYKKDEISVERRGFIKKSVFTIASVKMLTISFTVKSALNFYNERTETKNYLGFNGQIKDINNGLYFLGNGYRVYSPNIKRFLSIDSYSPFDISAKNPYAYCGGDPVNYIDPTGHISWAAIGWGIFSIIIGGLLIATGVGAVAGLATMAVGMTALVTAVTAGAAISAGVFGVTQGSLLIASGTVEDQNIANKLNNASVPFGNAATVLGIISAVGSAPAIFKSLGKNSQFWKKAIAAEILDVNYLNTHGFIGTTMTKEGIKSGHSLGLYTMRYNIVDRARHGSYDFMLHSCYGAFGGRYSQAQNLANHIQKPVRGWRGTVGDVPNMVASKLFRPQQSNYQILKSRIGNTALHGLGQTLIHLRHPTMIGW